jgi:SAM-dependent methyltransferase
VPNKKELDHMIDEYASWYSAHGDNHQSVGWNKPKHISRFKCLLDFWECIPGDKSIIDLGCGLAHLADHMKTSHPDYSYMGIDINQSFIDINKLKYPSYEFYYGAADDFTNKADVIVASGLFNRKFSDSKYFYFNTLNKMIDNARLGCSFNCLSSTALKKNDKNFYLSMNDVESIIDRTLLDGFIIDGDSIPGELTVHLRKKSNI